MTIFLKYFVVNCYTVDILYCGLGSDASDAFSLL